MGSTGWIYFTPYQPDIEKALQELREGVFRSGRYEYHIGQALDLSAVEKWDAEGNVRFQEMVERARQKAKSIEGLLEVVGYAGTHSILDIRHTAASAGDDVIIPASRNQLVEWLGTDQPTRDMVEGKQWDLFDSAMHPTYMVVYKDGSPQEICFFGCSGD